MPQLLGQALRSQAAGKTRWESWANLSGILCEGNETSCHSMEISSLYVCMYVRMYVCMYVYICIYVYAHVYINIFTYKCTYKYLYVCVCACMYIPNLAKLDFLSHGRLFENPQQQPSLRERAGACSSDHSKEGGSYMDAPGAASRFQVTGARRRRPSGLT